MKMFYFNLNKMIHENYKKYPYKIFEEMYDPNKKEINEDYIMKVKQIFNLEN